MIGAGVMEWWSLSGNSNAREKLGAVQWEWWKHEEREQNRWD
jgi:hypothetical protein